MADRGHESPMDFQWDGTGPGDPNSPFRRAFAIEGRKQSSFFPQPSPTRALSHSPPPTQTPYTFSTPYTKLPHTPHSVRPPPPQPIFRTPSFTTPRHSFNTPSRDSDIFSDGTPRTPRTPEVESEAPTPEAPKSIHSPIKGAGNKAAALASLTPSRITGRGELRRGIFHDTTTTTTKIRRRKLPSRDFPISPHIPEDSDSDSESDYPDHDDHNAPPQRQGWRRSAKSAASQWVATHRELPLIASHYLQLFFNLSLLLLLLYALLCFYLTIRRDVDQKVVEYSDAIVAESSLCARQFIANNCAPDTRAPALESQCSFWEKCMNRDSAQIGRARVSAETFAEIINSFIEPISYKTMFFVLLLVFGGLFISNAAFGFFRTKTVEPMPMPYMTVPPTPGRWDRESQQQLMWESRPAPSTPARMVGYRGAATPSRTGGRERMTGRKEVSWR